VLFPAPDAPRLIGIARSAAESEQLEAKRRVQYFELRTRSFITHCISKRAMPFEWTINPYRGCEFGCKYCYARYTHEFMELRDPVQFETLIYAKEWSETAFRDELHRIPHDEHIAIGTATDPYQPAERRFGITRKILKVFGGGSGRSLSITTKSDAAARDADVLAAISRRNAISVNMTVTTMDEDLARLLEPFAPRPTLRIAAVRKLTEAGINCNVFCCPVMPLINDSERSIERVAEAAAEAGASWFMGNPLFLKPCSKQVFLSFIEERFPKLARRYRERYEKSAFLKGDYPEVIKERIAKAREKFGLTRREVEYFEEPPQLSLFDDRVDSPERLEQRTEAVQMKRVRAVG
jgi:DNA repair photolyase